jgi:Domain of unknown function (DUF4340)
MSPKSLAILALATAASVGLAAHAVQQRDLPVRSMPAGGAMFPDLLDRLNELREVRIVGPDGTLTVVSKDQGWALAEKAGYPVDPAQLRSLGLAVANLQLVEAKTADPARIARLELEEPGATDAKSRLVELKGAEGAPLASVVVGKRSPSLYGSGRGGIYVRRNGENQAWLAAGELDIPSDAMLLIGQDVVDVPADQIARVILQPESGAPITLARAEAEAEFTVDAALPEGRKLDPVKVEFLAGVLAGLTMTDVQPATELPAAATRDQLRFETFDGLPVEVQLATIGEGETAEYWLTLRTSAPTATPDPIKEASPLADEIRKLDGWAYQVPAYMADRMKGGLDGLLAEPTPAS